MELSEREGDWERYSKKKTKRLKQKREIEGQQNYTTIKTLQEELGLLLEKEDMKWK